MPRKLGAVNIFEAAWLNRFLGDAREFRRLRKVEENFSEVRAARGEIENKLYLILTIKCTYVERNSF